MSSPSIYGWSKTPIDNTNSDPAINWQENQQPGTVNDSGRAMMARDAEYVEDQGGGILTANGPNIITVTLACNIESYFNGLKFTVRSISTNTGAATLNVNSFGAKPIKVFDSVQGEVDVKAGQIREGGIYVFAYSSVANNGNGGWILLNPTAAGSAKAIFEYRVAYSSSAALTQIAWTTWPLDVEVYDPAGLGSLSANTLTTTRAGILSWSAHARLSAVGAAKNTLVKTRLFNATDSLVVKNGSVMTAGNGGDGTTSTTGTSDCSAPVEANKAYRVQYYFWTSGGSAVFNDGTVGAPDLGDVLSLQVRLEAA